ncbi:hypothetical protein WMY93_018575 [Mugilogobius chulae]|uniref:Uncharacterized protein n=1 Tax=Mugilogobius chulae TaxID=88201 RepID=A0AAW0NJP0_9GOBI
MDETNGWNENAKQSKNKYTLHAKDVLQPGSDLSTRSGLSPSWIRPLHTPRTFSRLDQTSPHAEDCLQAGSDHSTRRGLSPGWIRPLHTPRTVSRLDQTSPHAEDFLQAGSDLSTRRGLSSGWIRPLHTLRTFSRLDQTSPHAEDCLQAGSDLSTRRGLSPAGSDFSTRRGLSPGWIRPLHTPEDVLLAGSVLSTRARKKRFQAGSDLQWDQTSPHAENAPAGSTSHTPKTFSRLDQTSPYAEDVLQAGSDLSTCRGLSPGWIRPLHTPRRSPDYRPLHRRGRFQLDQTLHMPRLSLAGSDLSTCRGLLAGSDLSTHRGLPGWIRPLHMPRTFCRLDQTSPHAVDCLQAGSEPLHTLRTFSRQDQTSSNTRGLSPGWI